jgi:hypothetical protein
VIGGGMSNHLDLIVNKPPVLDWSADVEVAMIEKAMQHVYQKCMRMYG